MQKEELMVGDWAYIKEYPMRSEPKKMTAPHYVRSLCEFEPIPLTEEILKKNGYFYQRRTDNGWYISFTGCKRYLGTIYIQYVHELQQALRFCGKIEQANSITI